MNNATLFDERLIEGIDKENDIAWLFYKFGCAIEPDNIDGSRDFNVRIKGRWERIEVKNEDRYSYTGNICIEIYQGLNEKKPSGIMISESTICIHTLKDNSIIYRTNEMRLWLIIHKKEIIEYRKDFKEADNGNGGYILPIKIIQNKRWFEYLLTMDIPTSKLFGEKKSA
jgi:hypothetical protein